MAFSTAKNVELLGLYPILNVIKYYSVNPPINQTLATHTQLYVLQSTT